MSESNFWLGVKVLFAVALITLMFSILIVSISGGSITELPLVWFWIYLFFWIIILIIALIQEIGKRFFPDSERAHRLRNFK